MDQTPQEYAEELREAFRPAQEVRWSLHFPEDAQEHITFRAETGERLATLTLGEVITLFVYLIRQEDAE